MTCFFLTRERFSRVNLLSVESGKKTPVVDIFLFDLNFLKSPLLDFVSSSALLEI